MILKRLARRFRRGALEKLSRRFGAEGKGGEKEVKTEDVLYEYTEDFQAPGKDLSSRIISIHT